MNRSRRLLILGGTVLAAVGMLYGLHYAVFVEHQTLDRMGSSLAGAFANAAERHWDDSQSALIAYRETKYDYVRQVDVHSHWIGLAMLMIVLGVVFDEVAFGDRARFAIALAMLARFDRLSAGSDSADGRGWCRWDRLLAIARFGAGYSGVGSDGSGIYERRRRRYLKCIPELFTITARARFRKRAAMLSELGDEAKLLAGGQSLIPLMKLRYANPGHLVDLNFVPGTSYIKEENGALRFGALTRHAEIEASPVAARIPIIHDCAAGIADVQVRNRGTIGGSLAEADPSGDWATVLMTLADRSPVPEEQRAIAGCSLQTSSRTPTPPRWHTMNWSAKWWSRFHPRAAAARTWRSSVRRLFIPPPVLRCSSRWKATSARMRPSHWAAWG